MNTKRYIDKKEYLRLQGYLYDLHSSGKVCIFSDFSGHVDQLSIRVGDSIKNYSTFLYGDYYGSGDLKIATDYKRNKTDKEIIDTIIEDIEWSIQQRDSKIAEQKEKDLEYRKKRYEELKKEFEESK